MKLNVRVIAVIIVVFVAFSTLPLGKTEEETPTYTSSFQLLNRPNGDVTYELNVTISEELFEYYRTRSHSLFTPEQFGKFVTPYTLKPIADRLWQIYNNPENFTNGVLMLVHQIAYEETLPGKYPIETLVAGIGDCDLFALIAASILKAGGINTVLLYYKDELHVEIGVQLASAPKDARNKVCSVTYDNVTYYIGECTGGNLREGWRVGECPTQYQNVSAKVITLENVEQTSIGQVTANLKELDPSNLTIQTSSSIMLSIGKLTITGKILPEATEANVTIQAKINHSTWTTIGNVQSQQDGRYTYEWTPPTVGEIAIQASWAGNKQYNGATSAEVSLTIVPWYVVAVISASVAAIVIASIAFIKTRPKKQEVPSAPASVDTQPPSQTKGKNGCFLWAVAVCCLWC